MARTYRKHLHPHITEGKILREGIRQWRLERREERREARRLQKRYQRYMSILRRWRKAHLRFRKNAADQRKEERLARELVRRVRRQHELKLGLLTAANKRKRGWNLEKLHHGEKAEVKFFKAFEANGHNPPEWFTALEWSSRHQDSEGVDFFLYTAHRSTPFRIQVKCSENAWRTFRERQAVNGRYNLDIHALVVHPTDSKSEIQAKVERLLRLWGSVAS